MTNPAFSWSSWVALFVAFTPLDALAQSGPAPVPAPAPVAPAPVAPATSAAVPPNDPAAASSANEPAPPSAAASPQSPAIVSVPAPGPLTPSNAAPSNTAPSNAAVSAVPAPPPGSSPPAPARLSVGSDGFFQPGINLQGWFFVSRQDQTTSTFRLRRAELRVKGEIIPRLFAYQVMIDPAKTLKFANKDVPVDNQNPPSTPPETVSVPTPPADTSILQDFFITLLTPFADVSLGQFKIPVSYEGTNSASKLLFPERSLVSRAFGDRRDLGIKAEKKFSYVGYALGVFSGQGQNQLDTNNQKDLSLRLEGYPAKGIVIAGVGYVGIGQRSLPGTKDRVEADVRAEVEHALIQGEYIHGWDVNAAGTRVEGRGAYGVVGYTFAEVYQPLIRVGFLDPDVHSGNTSAANSLTKHYEAGFNYYLRKDEVKFQLSYGLFDSGLAGTKLRHEGTFSAQIAF